MGKSEKVADEIPIEVSSLLDNFEGLAPDELLASLLSLCDIQHHIDFFPGAILPNLPYYRMSPSEHAKLQRQIKDLVNKGLIRKSLSPCVVPSLFNSKRGWNMMCIDSGVVNKITVKYWFPIP